MLNLDIKYYEYHTTEVNTIGPVKPPEGEGWFFVAMSGGHLHNYILWARQKKR